MNTRRFSVTGMSCTACSARVEQAVSSLPGVNQVQVNLLTRSMRVRYDESRQTPDGIISAVQLAGYGASLGEAASPEAAGIRKRMGYSLLCLAPLMALHHFLHSETSTWLQFLLLVPILILNRQFFISGTRAALHRAPNMDTLIALGAATGIIYSLLDLVCLHSGVAYMESAAMILTLITLGKWLESRVTGQTGDALSKLKALLPQEATRLRDGQPEQLPANEVKTGDTLLIAPGEKVPVDATVTEGCSSIDDSQLTGESIPQLKQAGSRIYAGTINGNGALRATALCTREESALSSIIHLVGEAAASKVPIARLADRLAGIFVPMVVSLALLTAVVWLLCGATIPIALGCAIAVLVISCPCALGLATPVAIMAGAGKGAENGIIFRNGATMETASRVNTIILDKTGTITSGHPTVIGVTPAPGVSLEALLQLAASLEQHNTHPLARCIRQYTRDFTPQPAEQLQYLPGRGICARLGGETALAGNAELLAEHGLEPPRTPAGGNIAPLFCPGGTVHGHARRGRHHQTRQCRCHPCPEDRRAQGADDEWRQRGRRATRGPADRHRRIPSRGHPAGKGGDGTPVAARRPLRGHGWRRHQ